MNASMTIDYIKAIRKEHPEWYMHPMHKSFLRYLIRTVRIYGETRQDEWLPFWPDMAIKHATSGKAAE